MSQAACRTASPGQKAESKPSFADFTANLEPRGAGPLWEEAQSAQASDDKFLKTHRGQHEQCGDTLDFFRVARSLGPHPMRVSEIRA